MHRAIRALTVVHVVVTFILVVEHVTAQNGAMIVTVYSFVPLGPEQWYLASGQLTNNVFTATLDKYVNGQCISCAYTAPSLSGNDGTITITLTSTTTATADLPGGRHIQIERYLQ